MPQNTNGSVNAVVAQHHRSLCPVYFHVYTFVRSIWSEYFSRMFVESQYIVSDRGLRSCLLAVMYVYYVQVYDSKALLTIKLIAQHANYFFHFSMVDSLFL